MFRFYSTSFSFKAFKFDLMHKFHLLCQKHSLIKHHHQRFLRDRIKTDLANFQCTFPSVDLTLIETTFKKCSVCMNSLAINDFPQRKITSFCSHEVNVCLTCVSSSPGFPRWSGRPSRRRINSLVLPPSAHHLVQHHPHNVCLVVCLSFLVILLSN